MVFYYKMTNNNKVKGDLYEEFVAEKLKNENNEVFLWKKIPENILYEMNYVDDWNEFRLEKIKYKLGKEYDNNKNYFIDTGIDILVKENEKYEFIQCKNWNKKLGFRDISTFLGMCFLYNSNGKLYYTLKDGLNRIILENKCPESLKYIYLPFEKKEQEKPSFQLRDYQIESSNLCKDFFVKNNRGTLALPCGTGKTEIMIEISKNFDLTIILSPLRALAKQTLKRFQDRLNLLKHQSKLVDSDGERDTLISGVKIISATFKSADIINKILEKVDLGRTLIIIDEFHNLSKKDIPIDNFDDEEFEEEIEEEDIEEENSEEEIEEEYIEEENSEEEFEEKTEVYKLLKNEKNKILFVSATPRVYELEDNYDIELGEIIYQMSLNEAIHKNLICDYKIYYPLIHNLETEFENYTNITNKITWFLNSINKLGLTKIIVYCESKEDIEEMKEEILLRQEYYALDLKMDTITDIDSSKTRNIKLKNFEENEDISVLFSIRILDEGIDIPCCDSVFISYPSKAKIRNIQRIMRACRLYSLKNYAKVLYWTDNDEDLEFLSSLKEFDPELKFKLKVISNKYEEFESIEMKEKENKLIIQSVGIRQYSWELKLKECEKFIEINKKKPSSTSNNKYEKQIGKWLVSQNQNLKNNKCIIKNKDIRKKYDEFINNYKEYFLSNEEIWYNNLEKVKNYIEINKKIQSAISKNKDDKKISNWFYKQIINYKRKQKNMKNENIRIKWEEFISKYNQYFLSNEEIWNNNLQKCIEFIDKYNKRPNSESKNNNEKKIGKWIIYQLQIYKNKKHIMNNQEIRNKWDEFIEKKTQYFLSNEEIWENNLQKLIDFINKNNKRPSSKSKNIDEKNLSYWISQNLINYKNDKQIMKNKEIRIKFEDFLNQYNENFLSNEEIWNNNLQKLEKFINENNKRPNTNSKDNYEKQIGKWINVQLHNYNIMKYNMTNEKIRIKWEKFISKYNQYFLSNEEIWNNNLQKFIDFIEINNKKPSIHSKNIDEKKLYTWSGVQIKNYKNKKKIMTNQEIKKKWENFIQEYKQYFK